MPAVPVAHPDAKLAPVVAGFAPVPAALQAVAEQAAKTTILVRPGVTKKLSSRAAGKLQRRGISHTQPPAVLPAASPAEQSPATAPGQAVPAPWPAGKCAPSSPSFEGTSESCDTVYATVLDGDTASGAALVSLQPGHGQGAEGCTQSQSPVILPHTQTTHGYGATQGQHGQASRAVVPWPAAGSGPEMPETTMQYEPKYNAPMHQSLSPHLTMHEAAIPTTHHQPVYDAALQQALPPQVTMQEYVYNEAAYVAGLQDAITAFMWDLRHEVARVGACVENPPIFSTPLCTVAPIA